MKCSEELPEQTALNIETRSLRRGVAWEEFSCWQRAKRCALPSVAALDGNLPLRIMIGPTPPARVE